MFESAARLARMGISVTRIGLVMVPVWIGGLKAFRYEVEGIMPFMDNSPFIWVSSTGNPPESPAAPQAPHREGHPRGDNGKPEVEHLRSRSHEYREHESMSLTE